MESGNSGSLQSSSGGDAVGGGGGDINPSSHFNSLPILQSSSNFFDPPSFSPNPNPTPNSMYNLDSLWSRNANSDSIYSMESHQDQYLHQNPVDDNLNHEKLGVTTKNPKKRTRASRRAPTTVLTTDTTNFRQMVQEFTGIPAAPFASSSSSRRSNQIDLYGGGISPATANPVRPSAQKFQLQQQPSYLNSVTATTGKLHIPPSETQGLTKQPLNLSNLQNQMFPFQSLSQTSLALPQQGNVTEPSNAFLSNSSLKRWRGQDENLMTFEGVNGNSQNAVVSSRNDGDHPLSGNEDSWFSPSD